MLREVMVRRLIILHVEDNNEDSLVLAQTCRAVDLPVDLHEVSDGAEAVAYLNGDGAFADRGRYPQPDVIVLDLRMPGMDGFEFLTWLRSRPAFGSLPVLVFTCSPRGEDKVRALAAGATGYFLKPVSRESMERLTETLKSLGGAG
jgi:two-component system response regulator